MDTILNEGAGLAASRAIWADRNPMGRMGDVEELSGAVILLCSKQAGRYINGVDIVVDGEWLFRFLDTMATDPFKQAEVSFSKLRCLHQARTLLEQGILSQTQTRGL